jgi:hypothetical protein
MDEETPLPLSRMATINKPSFWVFIGICLALYVINKIITPDTLYSQFVEPKDMLIIGAAFVGLILNTLIELINKKPLVRVLTVSCYIFEVISVVVLAILVFGRF